MLRNKAFSIAFSILVLGGCTPKRIKPFQQTNQVYQEKAKNYADTIAKVPPINVGNDSLNLPNEWVGTTNFNMRKPNMVIIHHTAQNSCEQTLRTFTLPRTQVSAHYVICKDGTIHHMLSDYLRAWHAGASKWGNITDINSVSIGIELDNNGFEPFDTAQINSLLQLLQKLKTNYQIPAANFIGHGDIAPVRKNDPNIYFPWKMLSEKGFGLWYDEIATNQTMPAQGLGFDNPLQALRIIGYDVKDTTAAKRAFKRHFLKDTATILTDTDKAVLNNLYKKYL